jgi:hypothetical protein
VYVESIHGPCNDLRYLYKITVRLSTYVGNFDIMHICMYICLKHSSKGCFAQSGVGSILFPGFKSDDYFTL